VPTFPFNATFDESMGLLRELCAQGFRIVLSHPVEDPVVEHAEVTDALIAGLRLAPACFLTGTFTHRGVLTRVLSSGPSKGTRVIEPLIEGPVIELLVPRENVVDGKPTLLLGELGRQVRYKDHESEASRPASPALKKAYTQATLLVSEWATTDPALAFPIGAQALRRFRAADALVQQYYVGEQSDDPDWRVGAPPMNP